MDKAQGRSEKTTDTILTHEYLKEVFLYAMGERVPMNARYCWGAFLRSEALRFSFRYEWIKVEAFYQWVSNHPRLEIEDGPEWYGVVEISAT